MLAEVEFHTGLDDPLAHACKLLRKAVRQGSRVCVATPRPDRLSARLWSLEAREFPAHARPGSAASASRAASATARSSVPAITCGTWPSSSAANPAAASPIR